MPVAVVVVIVAECLPRRPLGLELAGDGRGDQGRDPGVGGVSSGGLLVHGVAGGGLGEPDCGLELSLHVLVGRPGDGLVRDVLDG